MDELDIIPEQIECVGWPAVAQQLRIALAINATCMVERVIDDIFLVEIYPCQPA